MIESTLQLKEALMSCDMLEFSTRLEISEADVFGALAAFFNLRPQDVVDEGQYWNLDLAQEGPHLGAKVYYWNEGLRTRVCVVSNFTITDQTFGELAQNISSKFETEVVIGDFRESVALSKYQFLAYFPNGSVWEAIEGSGANMQEVKLLKPL